MEIKFTQDPHTVNVLNFVFETKCELTFAVTMQKLQSAVIRTAKFLRQILNKSLMHISPNHLLEKHKKLFFFSLQK